MSELYRRLQGHAELEPFLKESVEDTLVALTGKPALVCIPGTDAEPRARFVSCLLHGNEDSGLRAVLDVLRSGERFPYDLWVFIGNVRAASQDGWFAHRYLDDQEDFNRVWALDAPTTRMRRCADAVLADLAAVDLEAAVDLHNNTGENPPYAVLPRTDAGTVTLSGVCADMGLIWRLNAHTLMEALVARCPAVAIECGLPARDASTAFAKESLGRFLAAESFGSPEQSTTGLPPGPATVFEITSTVTVRPEVPFAFGGTLSDELDLVLVPALDGANFGMLLAGTELGRIHRGAALPLVATDLHGTDVTDRYLTTDDVGRVLLLQDVTPAMMVTTVIQTRRDCLFYIARRR